MARENPTDDDFFDANPPPASAPPPASGGGAPDAEAQLRAAGGNLYTDSDLTGVLANISYAQNAGRNPQEIIDQAKSRYDTRRTNTPGPSDGGSNASSTWGGDGGIAPYGQYSTLQRPGYLGQYTAPTWNQTYTMPTQAEVEGMPGYQIGLTTGQRAINASAASKGGLFNPGTSRNLAQFGTDYAGARYDTLNQQRLDAYKQNYSQFLDSAGLGAQARGINEGAYQFDVGAGQNQYAMNYQNYLDLITNRRNARNDYWSQSMDLAHNALTASGLRAPANPT